MQAVYSYPRLIGLSMAILAAMLAAGIATDRVRDRHQRQAAALAMTGGDAAQAPSIFRRYGCAGCHTIPGIPGADGKVGGPLEGLRQRVYIGGVLNNTPENLIDWIVAPQRFSPQTAMPQTGISKEEARHLAAYLYEK